MPSHPDLHRCCSIIIVEHPGDGDESGPAPRGGVVLRRARRSGGAVVRLEDVGAPRDFVTVVRFIPEENATAAGAVAPAGGGRRSLRGSESRDLSVDLAVEGAAGLDYRGRNKLDEEIIRDFKMANSNGDSVSYSEIVASNGEETVAAIRSMDRAIEGTICLLWGGGQGMTSPLIAGLTDWSECPELRAIGDLLASSNFAARTSVLVVQQYCNLESSSPSLSLGLGLESVVEGEGEERVLRRRVVGEERG
ncbi:unnamed protein product [Linum trigynum]|uniref:Uncharacterized protein n=1 Tax=Linum trigynum TaxID=586398 RepID=A0AAV2G5S7_9ROSI